MSFYVNKIIKLNTQSLKVGLFFQLGDGTVEQAHKLIDCGSLGSLYKALKEYNLQHITIIERGN